MTINSVIIGTGDRGGGRKDRGQSKWGMRIKEQLLGGLNEAGLLVLRLMEGLPDTDSHPAQMGIGISYNIGIPRENSIECMWEVSRLKGA